MILCCGEALIDMLPLPEGRGFAPHAGGAVFNTAIALGRLGAPSAMFTGLSADFLGEILRDELAASGVDTSASVVANRPCTLAFVKLVDGQATYAFYDENTAGRMLSPTDLPQVQADALFFGGISLMVEPCAQAYEALCLREAPTSVIMLDPNIRPGFIQDAQAYRARLKRMLAVADIVKISTEDLDWIADEEGRSDDFVTELLSGSVSIVLITNGAKGATAITRNSRISVPAKKVAVVDTVGAGDTFNAGVLASLQAQGLLSRAALAGIDDESLRQALALGVAASAVTVSRAGANPPWARELA